MKLSLSEEVWFHIPQFVVAVQYALIGEGRNPLELPWAELGYLHGRGTEDAVKGISHWIITDLNTQVSQAARVCAPHSLNVDYLILQVGRLIAESHKAYTHACS